MAENETSPSTSRTGNSKNRASASTARSHGGASASSASEETMKRQIAELRREVNKINRVLTEQAEEGVESAQGWYDSAADRASRAAKQLRSQAHSVSETVQQNPGTISSAMMLGGLFGVLVGMAIARSAEPEPDWFRRWSR